MTKIGLYVAACALLISACGGITERPAEQRGGEAGASGQKNNPQPASGGSGAATTAGAAGAAVSASGAANAGGSANPVTSSSCFNDTDCAGAQCGGDVCDWTKPAPNPVAPDKPFTCRAAGVGSKGRDGWCTTDENCKCRGLGAKCVAPYCTFTRPSDAPP